MIDLAALKTLRSIADAGTMARAAEELGFTPSAVSQQIKRLEKQVGVRLVAAAGRGVVLTPPGRALVDGAPEVLAALERCTEAARSVSDGTPRGVLRVAAFSTSIRGLLAPLMGDLAEAYPALTVAITEFDPTEAVRAVDAGEADLALVHDADGVRVPIGSALVQRLVHVDSGDVAMRADHRLAALRRPLRPADLVDCEWVTSPEGTVCHRWFLRLFADIAGTPDVRHRVDDFATQLALVGGGGTVALIPRLARPRLPDGVVVRELVRPPLREVHAVWRRSGDASPALRVILDALGTTEVPDAGMR